jgi:hypothetical protein
MLNLYSDADIIIGFEAMIAKLTMRTFEALGAE